MVLFCGGHAWWKKKINWCGQKQCAGLKKITVFEIGMRCKWCRRKNHYIS